jgi:hypothetical protein
MMLGRLPADHMALAKAPRLSRFMRAAAPPPPRLDRSHLPFTPEMDGNDVLPNCTAVGLANCARAFAILNGYATSIPTDKVVAFYTEAGGTDEGAVELDVLGYQLANGFDTGDQTRFFGTFGTFNPSDRAMFANAMAKCGAVYLGVDLALADQDMSVPWDTSTPGDQHAGSWGGHCLVAWDYTGLGDKDTVRLGTWGAWQPATWDWLDARSEEAHVVIWRQLMSASGKTLGGVDYAGLQATNATWAAA